MKKRPRSPSKITRWHRLMGISITDVLTDLMSVTQELELGQSSLRLDVAAERITSEPLTDDQLAQLPDGLQMLGDNNLTSFKSGQESLAEPDVVELFAYAVAYAKRNWQKEWRKGFTERRLRLFLVAVLRPHWLDHHSISVRSVLPGVYDLTWLSFTARLIVPREVELIPRNTLWHLYSGVRERVQYGLDRFAPKDSTLYNVAQELIELYGFQDMYTKQDFIRETLSKFTPEQRLAGLLPKQRLEGLLPEQRLEGLTPTEFLSQLSEEQQIAFRKAFEALSETSAASGKRG